MNNPVNPESLVNLSMLESIRQTKPNTFYLDHFVLLMLSLLPKNKSTVKSLDIQKLFSENLSMDIPLLSVNKISNRAVKNGFFKMVAHSDGNKTYSLIDEKIKKQNLKFNQLRDKVKQSQEKFFVAFQQFVLEKYQISIDLPKCKVLFYKHFIKHYTSIYSTDNSDGFSSGKIYNESYVVNDFIFHLYKDQKNKSLLECLELIIRGNWVLNYLFMWRGDAHKKNSLKGVTVFLDTPIIISLLGFHGNLSEKIIKELLILLNNLGIVTHVFSHNIEETQFILKSWAENIKDNKIRNMRIPVIKEIHNKSYDYQRLHSLATGLKSFLSKFKINEKLDPEISKKYRIDEEKIEKNISHPESKYIGNKVHVDIKSAKFIFSLRKGRATLNITDNPHIFVSSTYHVVNSINNFFKENYPDSGNKNISIFVNQDWLTNLCWISSSKKTSLPRDFLVANSYASLNADSKFWELVKDKLSTLEQQEKITEEGIDAIRFEETFKCCVEEHFVSKLNIENADIHLLIKKAKQKINKEYEQTIKNLKKDRENSQQNKERISNTIGHIIIIISLAIIICVFMFILPVIGRAVFSLFSFLGITFSYKKIQKFFSKKINKFLDHYF